MHRRHVPLFLLVFCSTLVLAGGPAPSPAPAAAQTPAAAPAKPAAGAQTYAVDPAKSSLGFTARQSGGDVDGKFEKFAAQISFADANLGGSRFDVTVQTQSINTGDDERDTALRDKDLFNVSKFPTAHFVTSAFTRKAAGQYEATGKLTIRDVTREIQLPFTFQTTQEGGKPVASLKGGVTLNRLDYGVGQGEWKDTSTVANEVRVKFELRLLPK
jgi:polyisoprenoid-binding protein YceI